MLKHFDNVSISDTSLCSKLCKPFDVISAQNPESYLSPRAANFASSHIDDAEMRDFRKQYTVIEQALNLKFSTNNDQRTVCALEKRRDSHID